MSLEIKDTETLVLRRNFKYFEVAIAFREERENMRQVLENQEEVRWAFQVR